ncbi:MAG: hypothetical protein FWF69_08085 [Firmicutes bacterium]|nr:hypothetical protein [Bacillota bacterium]
MRKVFLWLVVGIFAVSGLLLYAIAEESLEKSGRFIVKPMLYHDYERKADVSDEAIAIFDMMLSLSYLQPGMTFMEFQDKLIEADMQYAIKQTRYYKGTDEQGNELVLDALLIYYTNYLYIRVNSVPYAYEFSGPVNYKLMTFELVDEDERNNTNHDNTIERAMIVAVTPYNVPGFTEEEKEKFDNEARVVIPISIEAKPDIDENVINFMIDALDVLIKK